LNCAARQNCVRTEEEIPYCAHIVELRAFSCGGSVSGLAGDQMRISGELAAAAAVIFAISTGCGGGASTTTNDAVNQTNGSISVSITDGPWEDAQAMVLHITGMDLGQSNGDVIHLGLGGGPMSVDMMQLQNGAFDMLVSGTDVPIGAYEWMRLRIDASQSYMDLASTGARHMMQMGADATDGLEVHEPFQIMRATHSQFMLDFDLRRGVQHRDMGMMGDRYELHSAMRLINMDNAGGLSGMVAASMIDINHPDCDSAPGGNWAYLFPGDATVPDDIANIDSDGVPGPMATDRVEMDVATGDHYYHFGFLSPGSYRIAFTCSGEWDEDGDDDYPSDPDGRFDFQMFSGPMDVTAGQMHTVDLMP
jgi:hypothetical protein